MNSQKRRTAWWIMAALIIFCCGQAATAADTENSNIDLLIKTGDAIAQIAEDASPAVVSVSIEKTVKVQNQFGGNGNLFERFFGPDFQQFFNQQGQPDGQSYRFQSPPPQSNEVIEGLGSGIIIESSGYIITNNHVVAEADKVTVKLTNGAEYTAKVVGTDAPTDLAVVKVDAEGLPTLELGDSSKLRVGEWVIAIGNPFGLTRTVTVGVVSATGRVGMGIEDYEDFIQTDAAINRGNSGGPLLNDRGKVIGINTAIVSSSGGSVGIGFAIPSNMAKTIYQQLKEKGSVTRGYIGIQIQSLTPEMAQYFNMNGQKGILVAQVMPDSPGQKAGLKQGDIIIKLNGEPIKDLVSFRNKIAMTAPDTKIELTLIRNEKEQTVSVTIGKMPAQSEQQAGAPTPSAEIGMTVQNLTPDLAAQLGYQGKQGVVITQVQPGSRADNAGLQAGMLIEQVGRTPVANVEQFKSEITKEAARGSVLLLVTSKNGSAYVLIQLK